MKKFFPVVNFFTYIYLSLSYYIIGCLCFYAKIKSTTMLCIFLFLLIISHFIKNKHIIVYLLLGFFIQTDQREFFDTSYTNVPVYIGCVSKILYYKDKKKIQMQILSSEKGEFFLNFYDYRDQYNSLECFHGVIPKMRYIYANNFFGYFKKQDVQHVYNTGIFSSIKKSIFSLRKNLNRKIYNLFSEENRYILSSIILGNHSGAREDIELFRNTGIGHFVAISGLHIGIIGGLFLFLSNFFFFLFPKTSLFVNSKIVSSAVAMIAISFYFLISGQSPSVIRAYCMAMFCFINYIFQRDVISKDTLFCSFLVFVIFFPHYILYKSTIMSFCITAFIIALYNMQKNKKITFLKVILFSTVINLYSLFYSGYFFHKIPVYSFIVNLVCGFLGSIILCSAFLSILLPVKITGLFVFVAEFCLTMLKKVAEVFDSVPNGIIFVKEQSPIILIIYILATIAVFCFPRSRMIRLGSISVLITCLGLCII